MSVTTARAGRRSVALPGARPLTAGGTPAGTSGTGPPEGDLPDAVSSEPELEIMQFPVESVLRPDEIVVLA